MPEIKHNSKVKKAHYDIRNCIVALLFLNLIYHTMSWIKLFIHNYDGFTGYNVWIELANSLCVQEHVIPDSKVHVANMGSTWVLSTQVGPMLATWTFAIWDVCVLNNDRNEH